MSVAATVSVVYTRQSHGKERSVSEQETECRKACDELGWTVSEVYTDMVSASRYARKDRPDWARLLADLEAGRFGILVMWESSRGDRDLETWAGLLRRCGEHGVLIHVVNHGQTYDMANRRHWKTLADEGVSNAYRSDEISSELLRALERNATKGRPHGRVIYGYRRVYDEKTRELKRQEPDPKQAPIVREIVARVAGGEAVKAITDDLNRRRVKAAKGGPWNRTMIRKIAMNPAYIGIRRWGALEYDAIWPALVTGEDFRYAVRRLTDPARKTTKPGRQKYLLSYLALCWNCGGGLTMQPAYKGRRALYGCAERGCTYIRQDWLDGYVTGHLCARLNTPEFWDELLSGDVDDAGARQARAEEAELEVTLREYRELAGTGAITAKSFQEIESGLRARIADAQRRGAPRSVPPSLLAIYRQKDMTAIRELFEAQPVAVRRDILRGLYDGIVLLPSVTRGTQREFDSKRVLMVPGTAR